MPAAIAGTPVSAEFTVRIGHQWKCKIRRNLEVKKITSRRKLEATSEGCSGAKNSSNIFPNTHVTYKLCSRKKCLRLNGHTLCSDKKMLLTRCEHLYIKISFFPFDSDLVCFGFDKISRPAGTGFFSPSHFTLHLLHPGSPVFVTQPDAQAFL